MEVVLRGRKAMSQLNDRGLAVGHEHDLDGAGYDKHGELVGFNDPSVLTDLAERILANEASCDPPQGFTHGRFSSVITLF
jgi:hypothetical protein